MILALLYLIFGFIILIKGADWLVDSSSVVARKFGVSELTIGLTIVAFGSSLPELIVNVISSTQGKADLAFSNILGSNVANVFLILGVTALIARIPVNKKTSRYELPFTLLSSLVLLILVDDKLFDPSAVNMLSTADSLILISFFSVFLYYVAATAKNQDLIDENDDSEDEPVNMLKHSALIFAGLTGLYFGGKIVVNNAVFIAAGLGLSEALIGLTVVAIGTSLPELAASAIAAKKGKTDIAVGNVIGSILFNILWVLGISGMIQELEPAGTLLFDFSMQFFSIILLAIFAASKPRGLVVKWHGLIFLALYFSYLTYHIITEPNL